MKKSQAWGLGWGKLTWIHIPREESETHGGHWVALTSQMPGAKADCGGHTLKHTLKHTHTLSFTHLYTLTFTLTHIHTHILHANSVTLVHIYLTHTLHTCR